MVTIMTRIYPVLALVACANVAYAQDNSFLPDAKIPAGSAQTWNVGAGVTQKLLHTNLEWGNPYGIAYAKAGVFINDDYPVGGQLGLDFQFILLVKIKMAIISVFTQGILTARK